MFFSVCTSTNATQKRAIKGTITNHHLQKQAHTDTLSLSRPSNQQIMRFLVCISLLAAAAMCDRDYAEMFRSFKSTYHKTYANDEEESMRFKNFVQNMRKAEVLEGANPLASFGYSVFADLSESEFRRSKANGEGYFKKAISLHSAQKKKLRLAAPLADRFTAAGSAIDWRTKGAVTPVKAQEGCGGCWAFSATGNIESRWFIAGNGPLTLLSEQELLSCDHIDDSCSGGLMSNAFQWLINFRKGEIVTEAAFPYASSEGWSPGCKTPTEMNAMAVGAVITGYEVLDRNEDTLAAYVSQGPVSVAVDSTSWQMYRGGIVTNCVSRGVSHAALVVGYNDTNVPPYWIIKNSWGVAWGEQGYIRVAKGSNQCLITEFATTAIVKQGNGTRAN